MKRSEVAPLVIGGFIYGMICGGALVGLVAFFIH